VANGGDRANLTPEHPVMRTESSARQLGSLVRASGVKFA
jgi:hypothetical protein